MKRLAAVALAVLAVAVPMGTVPLAHAAFADSATASSTFATVDVKPGTLTVVSCGSLAVGGWVTFDVGASTTAAVTYTLTRTDLVGGGVQNIPVSVPGTVRDEFGAVLGNSYQYVLRARTGYGWYDDVSVKITWFVAGCSVG